MDQKQIKGPKQLTYCYCLNDVLGRGAFAEVYKGICQETQQLVAVKVINKSGIKKFGPDILKAIGNEVNILQMISKEIETPYIVKIFECFMTDNFIYIILEFCNQGNLCEVLEKAKGLPENEALMIIYQVVLALEILATKGIAHRDIKPDNIFISDGIYKLGDFGFASQKKMFETTLGTYPYMAPEIFQEKEYNCKVDIWAVAVMLHEMLFSELYFIGNSHMEVANNVKSKKYEIKNPGSITPQTQNLLINCLIKDPTKRLDAIAMKNHPAFDQVRKKFEVRAAIEKPNERIQEKRISDEEKVFYLFKNIENWYTFICKLGGRVLASNINERTLFAAFYLLKKTHLFFSGALSALQARNIPNELKKLIPPENWRKFCESQFANQIFQSFYANFLSVDQQLDEVITRLGIILSQYYEKESGYWKLVVNKDFINIDRIYDEELKVLKRECFEVGCGGRNRDILMMSFDLKRALDLGEKVSKCVDFNDEERRKEGLTVEKMMEMIGA